ncbi:MAG TPA: alpha/beta hydrolase [Dehalococcoidia bacterium]|nr:alpha/beta hydrolase [Dehalococcoidia bacterium]
MNNEEQLRSVQNGAVTIRYRVWGAGPPLLLLHPGMCDGSLWETLGYRQALEPHYRLIVPDLRGHGQSDCPHEPAAYTADAMRDDLGAVLAAERIERARCWGFSLGALLALRFAAAYRGRLRALIAGGAVGWLPRREVGTESAERIERRGLAALAPPVDGDPAALPLRSVILASDPTAHAARYRAQAHWEPPAGLHAIREPLLLYGGEADSFTPAVRELAAALSQAELFTVPKLGHLQLWCHPELLLERALAFLATVPGAKA